MTDEPLDAGAAFGCTVEGVPWRWRDGPLADSRLLLYPDIGVPTIDERWRHEQSLRAWTLFNHLQVPVSVEWVRPTPPRAQSEWTIDSDFFPRWEIREGDRHSFLFGIVDRLHDSLEFDDAVPAALEAEWQSVVASEYWDDDDRATTWLGVLRSDRARLLQQLFRKNPDGTRFDGGALNPSDLERLL